MAGFKGSGLFCVGGYRGIGHTVDIWAEVIGFWVMVPHSRDERASRNVRGEVTSA